MNFEDIQKLVYESCGLACTQYTKAVESKEYCASFFYLNEYAVQYRESRITPTKIGQFVTLWKRNQVGVTAPYDSSDTVDFFIITSQSGQQLGQFIFPKKVLISQGYVSHNGVGGKRAMRVYPPWDRAENDQAKKTQAWQLPYFIEIKPHFDKGKMKPLFLRVSL